ncbi:MAG: Rne/Rng family ribonuclease [Rickettsiales bacterium]
MSKKILIDAAYPGETRVVIHENNGINDFDYENSHKKQLKGNIYLARITRVEPSLQAAFIEYGGNKHGFLPFNEIHPSYFLKDIEVNHPQEETGASLADKIPAVILPEVTEEELHAKFKPQTEEAIASEAGDEENPLLDEKAIAASAEEVEADKNSNEDLVDEEELHPHRVAHQKYKIQDVLKKGQAILVQVIKEERGNKGAACTSYISLAGRYCVFMPNSDRQGGISRRIVNPNERRNLRNIVANLDIQEGVSIILRTAGAGRNYIDICRDYYYLARLWNAIREYAIKAKVNTFIHAETDLLKRSIRDLYNSEISEIQIQGPDAYKAAKEFMKKILPLHAHKIKEYKAKTPIFTKYNIEEKISSLYTPTVKLPSGGYIVINPTEALIAIDVNSGKATNERNIEETATKTNIEAAVEIGRQLRLRDMSGLIVIDFIDMMEASNRKMVERTLRDAFQIDRAKVQLGNISGFGLLELSRQRLQSSFTEANTTPCPSCSGKGHIKSFDSNALIILRAIESEIYQNDCETLNVYAHAEVILHLLNHKREELVRLEKLYNCRIIFHKENTAIYDGFFLEKIEKEKNSHKESSGPGLNEESIDSYDQDLFEDAVLKEGNCGLGQDIAPYQVNDESIINENAPEFIRHKVKKGRSFNSNNNKRRKISNAAHNDRSYEVTATAAEAVVPASPSSVVGVVSPNPNKEFSKRNNFRKSRNNRYNNNPNRNQPKEEASMLKKLWEKIVK